MTLVDDLQDVVDYMIHFLFRSVVLLRFSLLLKVIIAPFQEVDAEVNEVRIAVSDLLAGAIVEPLNNLAEEHSIDLSIDTIGSLPAIDYLRTGRIDLAIVATPETIELPGGDFQVCPFAFDATLVAVNDANPITEISLSSLSAIFGVNNDLNFSVWGDLKLLGWENRAIKPLAGQNDETISLELFKFMVLDGEEMKITVAEVKDSEVEDLIAADTNSIGILPDFPEGKQVKVLMISADSESPAFGPTNDNIYYGDYPIRLPFKILYKKNDLENIKDTLRILLSNELADVLSANNLYVPPVAVRRKLMLDLKLVE